MVEQFAELGYFEPFSLLSALECRNLLRTINDPHFPPPLDWNKGQAVTSRAFFEVGRNSAIVEQVSTLLGPDVMLWGASLQDRAPGAVHPWHSDIECAPYPGKTVTVWIGIENTNPDSSLRIIPRSHRFGVTVQRIRHELGRGRDEVTDEEIVKWARQRDERCDLLSLNMTDGDAVVLDGQVWHGSRNRFSKTRRALLLQYATPDSAILIPDLNYLDWPFRQYSFPKPACIMVKGSATVDVNRIVPPPIATHNGDAPERLTNRICSVELPLKPDEVEGWKPYFLFNGATSELASLSCHVSVLKAGHCPHPPHRHEEEELLMLLRGEVDITLPDARGGNGKHQRRLRAGQFVYYPLNFAHTLTTVSDEPANYLMFKWTNNSKVSGSHLKFGQFDIFDRLNGAVQTGFAAQQLFEGPTPYLRKLHCHTSTLTPSAGYEPHIDSHALESLFLREKWKLSVNEWDLIV